MVAFLQIVDEDDIYLLKRQWTLLLTVQILLICFVISVYTYAVLKLVQSKREAVKLGYDEKKSESGDQDPEEDTSHTGNPPPEKVKFKRRKLQKPHHKSGEEINKKEAQCMLLSRRKLLEPRIKYRSSRNWKNRRKANHKKQTKNTKTKHRNRIRSHKKKARKRRKEIRRLLRNFLEGNFPEISNDDIYISKSPLNGLFIAKSLVSLKPFLSVLSSYHNYPSEVILTLCPIYKSLQNYFESTESGDVPEEERMRYEWLRFMSFAGHRNIAVRPMFLARSGFYATANDDITSCYSCGARYGSWVADDVPNEVHHRISPNCLHITTGDSRNKPIHSDELVFTGSTTQADASSLQLVDQNGTGVPTSQTDRSTSDNIASPEITITDHTDQRVSDPSANNSSTTDDVTSLSVPVQRLSLSSSNLSTDRSASPTTDRPYSLSTQHHTVPNRSTNSNTFPTSDNPVPHPSQFNNNTSQTDGSDRRGRCSNVQQTAPHVTANSSVASSQLARLDPLGINFDRPRYPAYAVLSVRISSYQGWASAATQTPRQLGVAGFFYAGKFFFCCLQAQLDTQTRHDF